MDGAAEFLRAMAGARAIEVAAVALGLVNIALLIRRSLWNYPFGLAMVTLYAVIFFEAKLYADAGLQIFFFAIQIYGWMSWRRARGEDGLVTVRRVSFRPAAMYGAAALAGAAALGAGLDRMTDATHPYWDAAIASLSVCAQVMMAKRFLENWLVWIAVDTLAIGLFWTKGLSPTAALYAVFLVMSLAGYLRWRQTLRTRMSAS
ncbi:MAG: nicotinamide riboside transporter PnuC [Parvularculaceae bacterium]|nr:nicotinamide riboside transporter PnuC [Parvularculaceae bacterium]